MELNVVIPIDDTHPEKGWGLKDDECSKYLHLLNEEFGCKFTHFIPSNYHKNFPLSQYKDWVDYWKQFEWVELAAHGHFHQRTVIDFNCRECEFIELDYEDSKQRIQESLEEWDKVGIKPKGWRMPGWIASQGAFDAVGESFEYVAIHGHLNGNIIFPNKLKVFQGENPIHDNGHLILFDGNLLFQSHIAGEYNKNNWDKTNYEYFRNTLKWIEQSRKLSFKTFSELC
jgi:hypothetical protein